MLSKLQEDIIRNRIKDPPKDLEVYKTGTYDITKDLDQLPDIKEATKLLHDAISNKKPIILSIDIDCDGITSGVVGWYSLLKIFNVPKELIKLCIGTRSEGRGVTEKIVSRVIKIVDKLELNNIEHHDEFLLITSDHGSTDNDRYITLKHLYPKCHIIVTDHHEVEEEGYPHLADAFINTQRPNTNFSKCICGCATVFLLYLKTYIDYYKGSIKDFKIVMPYVSLATVVDMMSMDDMLNRYLVKEGVKIVNEEPDFNFQTMKKLLGLPDVLNFRDFSITIGPLINTGNRLGTEEFTLLSFVLEDEDKSLQCFNYINNMNKLRKAKTVDATTEATSSFEVMSIEEHGCVGIIHHDVNLCGPVASSISQIYGRPSLCLGITSNDFAVGSARTTNSIDVLNIIRTAGINLNLDIQANGHKTACGIKFRIHSPEDIPNFRKEFGRLVTEELDKLSTISTGPEFVLKQDELTLDKVNEIMDIGPYGINFELPLLGTDDTMVIKSIIPIKTFFKITFSLTNGESIEGMIFFKTKLSNGVNYGNFRSRIKVGCRCYVNFHLVSNFYRNKLSPSLEIVDIIPIY